MGRNANKLQALAVRAGVERWSTNLDECLADPQYSIYFDAQTTSAHAGSVKARLAAGKNVYCEKPLAPDVKPLSAWQKPQDSGLKNELCRQTISSRMRKLKRLVDSGFFGKILSFAESSATGFSKEIGSPRKGQLELPERRRRRNYPRYVLPLAIRAGRYCGSRKITVGTGRNSYRNALRRTG